VVQLPGAIIITIDLLTVIVTLCLFPFEVSIEAFFALQLLIGLVEIVTTYMLTWYFVSPDRTSKAKFDWTIIKRIWRYALGLNTLAVISLLFGRLDALIISVMLPIQYLGFYSLVQRIPLLVGVFPASLISATSPSLVLSHEEGKIERVRSVYQWQTVILSFIAVVFSGSLAVFAYPILYIWTGSNSIATYTAVPFAIMSIATIFDVMVSPVNQLSFVYGINKPAIVVNSISSVAAAIAALILIPISGLSGAALAWGMGRLVIYIFYPVFVHRLVLPHENRKWYRSYTLPLLGIGFLVFAPAWLFVILITPKIDFAWSLSLLLCPMMYVLIARGLNLVPELKSLARPTTN
jgi:O-antigen/teichoic acid export membrane protein